MPSYVEKKKPGIQDKSICPYPCNWDCICRQGKRCGAVTWEGGVFPDTCDFYKPVNENAIFDLETLFINQCEACSQHEKCTGDKKCSTMITINTLENTRRKYVKRRDKERVSNKSASGVTFSGKGKQK